MNRGCSVTGASRPPPISCGLVNHRHAVSLGLTRRIRQHSSLQGRRTQRTDRRIAGRGEVSTKQTMIPWDKIPMQDRPYETCAPSALN